MTDHEQIWIVLVRLYREHLSQPWKADGILRASSSDKSKIRSLSEELKAEGSVIEVEPGGYRMTFAGYRKYSSRVDAIAKREGIEFVPPDPATYN